MKIIASFLVFVSLNKLVFSEENWRDVKIDNINIPQPQVKSDFNQNINVDEILRKIDNFWGREDNLKEFDAYFRSINKGEVLFKKDLKPIKDRYLYDALVFNSSSGDEIYMSLTKSHNCPNSSDCKLSDKFFIVFSGDNKHEFVRVKDIINVSIFMSGSKTVEFYGEKYTVRIKANVSDIDLSKIEVISKSGKKVVDKTISELREYMTKTGYDLSIEKRKYKIFYGRKLECFQRGCVFKDTNICFIVEYPVDKDTTFVTIDEEKWDGKDIYFESIGKNYLFNITNGVLNVSK